MTDKEGKRLEVLGTLWETVLSIHTDTINLASLLQLKSRTIFRL